jgi:hypothetical protein
MRAKQTPEERREKARLRSERWRRAHGIWPARKPAQRPWLALGHQPQHHYRRRAKAREQAAADAPPLADKAPLPEEIAPHGEPIESVHVLCGAGAVQNVHNRQS